jgi:hypothetical protein
MEKNGGWGYMIPSTISDRETLKNRVDVALVEICIKNLISEHS